MTRVGNELLLEPDLQFTKKKKAGTVAKAVILIAFALILTYMLLLFSNYFDYTNIPQKSSDKCYCRWKRKYYNICYHMPYFPHSEGTPFSCSHLPIIQDLNLLDDYPIYGNTPAAIVPIIVTAFSSNYFTKGLNMIAEYKKVKPGEKIVVYDLGLRHDQYKSLKSLCNVIVEKLEFSKYPKYVSILKEYRWKPIVIMLALKKYGPIIYVDSSVRFRNSNYLTIPGMINCRAMDEKSASQCSKFPYMLHSFTGHSIGYATMPSVYRYFPTLEEEMKSTKMYEAGLVYVAPTKETFEILKWSTLCALEEFCIVPYHAPLHSCRIQAESSCHRFDQSVINILLYNANKYKVENYTSGITNFFAIHRDDEREPNYRVLTTC